MAANKPTNSIVVLLVVPILFLQPGCHRGGGSVSHGSLSYNATEVFGSGTAALKLAEAAGRGDVKGINREIAAGVNVNAVGQHGITPLWWAAFVENHEGFAALLDKGADPNAQRAERYPIMHLIADKKDPRFLEAALKHGGNPNLRDSESGETPLFPAVQNNCKPQIDLLLAAGADVNVQTAISRETLPMAAVGASVNYQLVYRLFQAGADPTLKTKTGHTIADDIELASINASNNDDPWRAKVMEYLRSKGVTAKKPSKQ